MEAGMRLECAAAITSDPDPLIEPLAVRLLALAGDQSVRTVEALAAVLTNQGDEGALSLDDASAICPPGGEASAWQEAGRTESNGKFSLCRRVARRAVRRSLLDPTGGANAFHRIDASPGWSRRSLPVATFGSFLFYRL
jgi:N-acetylmuramoyl-L-alanine amidase